MITTPNEISKEIFEFCKEIDPTTKPAFVKFSPVEGYVMGSAMEM